MIISIFECHFFILLYFLWCRHRRQNHEWNFISQTSPLVRSNSIIISHNCRRILLPYITLIPIFFHNFPNTQEMNCQLEWSLTSANASIVREYSILTFLCKNTVSNNTSSITFPKVLSLCQLTVLLIFIFSYYILPLTNCIFLCKFISTYVRYLPIMVCPPAFFDIPLKFK